MSRSLTLRRRFVLFSAIACIVSCKTADQSETAAKKQSPSLDATKREAYIRKAQTWLPGSDQTVGEKDLALGVPDPFFTKPKQDLDCTFVEPSLDDIPGGRTPKFECAVMIDGKAKKFKIKYDPYSQLINGKRGTKNLEVYGEVLATRLLWALGFLSDRIYTVRVHCKGCPPEPWTYIRKKLNILDHQDSINGFVRKELIATGEWEKKADRTFEPAVIEVKYPSPKIEPADNPGWAWKEMYEMIDDPEQQKLHRDALTILAAFIDHADNKASQQRLVCKDAAAFRGELCTEPFLMIQDAGASFGNGWAPLQGDLSLNKIDLEKWKNLSLWNDLRKCEVQLHGFVSGSFRSNWKVTEESRAFVAKLFASLSDKQIKDLFTASQVGLVDPKVTENDWIAGFKAKVKRDLLDSKCG